MLESHNHGVGLIHSFLTGWNRHTACQQLVSVKAVETREISVRQLHDCPIDHIPIGSIEVDAGP
jgi:hypothetical protein